MASDQDFCNSEKAEIKSVRNNCFETSVNVHLWFLFITSCMLKSINILALVKSVTEHLLEINN